MGLWYAAFKVKSYKVNCIKGVLAALPVYIVLCEWSILLNVDNKDFYEVVLHNFSNGAVSFIEDKMHSVAQEYPNHYRLAIYSPKGNIKRTYHTDGRAGENKYDESQVF